MLTRAWCHVQSLESLKKYQAYGFVSSFPVILAFHPDVPKRSVRKKLHASGTLPPPKKISTMNLSHQAQLEIFFFNVNHQGCGVLESDDAGLPGSQQTNQNVEWSGLALKEAFS